MRITTRTIKCITTVLLFVALVLMLSGAWVVRRPRGMTSRSYLERIAAYGGVLGLAAIGAGVGAFAILRREQAFYREKAMENMRSLIEATRQDQLRKNQPSDGPDAQPDDA